MSEIQRYSAGAISESEFGRFVLYSDYAQLTAERDLARKQVAVLQAALDSTDVARNKFLNERDAALQDLEQQRVQHAGCLTYAEGWSLDTPAKPGDYGWSLANQKVLELRQKYERLREAALVVSSFEVAAGSDKEYADALRNLRIALGVSLVQDEDGNESKIM